MKPRILTVCPVAAPICPLERQGPAKCPACLLSILLRRQLQQNTARNEMQKALLLLEVARTRLERMLRTARSKKEAA